MGISGMHGDDLRRVMRSAAATVTIVTTHDGKRSFGMVATAVVSLSLEPPVLAVAVNRTASIHDPLMRRGAFCVNVLSQYDEDIGRAFAQLSGEQRFSVGDWRQYASGEYASIPYLDSAQAAICCRTVSQVEIGTHTLFLGEATEIITENVSAPLLYCEGSFGSFAPTQHAAAE